jgi:membrane protease YdiL (CAAX protease family)
VAAATEQQQDGGGRWARCRGTLGVIAALNAFGLALLALLWLLAGDGERGLGAYFQVISRQTRTAGTMAAYCLGLVAYAVALEAVLRLAVQRPLRQRLRRWGWLAIALPALLYGATHARYHLAGVLYATALGAATALVYQRRQRWWELALWHAQWQAVAVIATGVLGIAGVTSARAYLLAEYKARQVRAGILRYRPEWGWEDISHQDPELYAAIDQWLARPPAERPPLRLEYRVLTPVGMLEIASTYELAEPPPDALAAWGVGAGIFLDFHIAVEEAQQAAGWRSGSQLSAWRAEDLPSALLAALERYPAADRVALPEPVTDQAALAARWAQEGHREVARLVHPEDLPGLIPPAWQPAWAVLVRERARWRCTARHHGFGR